MNPTGGVLYIGSKGKMLQDTYGLNPRLLPKSLHDSTPQPANKLPRIAHEEHEMNWVEAIKGKAEISSPFEYAARLTEVMLLGIAVAARRWEDPLRRREHEGDDPAERERSSSAASIRRAGRSRRCRTSVGVGSSLSAVSAACPMPRTPRRPREPPRAGARAHAGDVPR